MDQGITNRFKYHPADTAQRKRDHEMVRAELGRVVRQFDQLLPDGREKALAFTKLEEAMFWANAAIARQGVQDE